MKGYEDVAATLVVLGAVLVGGYFYLQSETYHQKQSLHQVETEAQKKVEYDWSKFEVASKRTE